MTDDATLDEMIDRGARAHREAVAALAAGDGATLCSAALVRETIAEAISTTWPGVSIGVARARMILLARRRR